MPSPRPVAPTVIAALMAVLGLSVALMSLATWVQVFGRITGTLLESTVLVEDFHATVSGTGTVDIVSRDSIVWRQAPTRTTLVGLVGDDVSSPGTVAIAAGVLALISAVVYALARPRWIGIVGTIIAATTGIIAASVGIAGLDHMVGARSFSANLRPGTGAVATLALSIALLALAGAAALIEGGHGTAARRTAAVRPLPGPARFAAPAPMMHPPAADTAAPDAAARPLPVPAAPPPPGPRIGADFSTPVPPRIPAPPRTRVPGGPAGSGRRFAAFAIDVSIIVGLIVAVSVATMIITGPIRVMWVGTVLALSTLLFATVPFAYFLCCDATTGRTVGRRLLGIAVVDAQGQVPALAAVARRSLPAATGLLVAVGVAMRYPAWLPTWKHYSYLHSPLPPVLGGLVTVIGLLAVAAVIVTLAVSLARARDGRGAHDRWAATTVIDLPSTIPVRRRVDTAPTGRRIAARVAIAGAPLLLYIGVVAWVLTY